MVAAGIVSAVVSHRLQQSSNRAFMVRMGLWIVILVGIIFAQPIYDFLFSNKLTETEPLSLFDVIQITGIIFTLFIANRAYIKADMLESRVQDLHQELSIRISENKPK